MTQQCGSISKTSVSDNDNNNSTQPLRWSSLWRKVGSSYSLKKSVGLTKNEVKEENFPSSIERLVPPEVEPDARLENWGRWLDIHKKQQDKLSNILKRPPQCLLMNMNFNSLHVNQEKRLISEASNYQFCDKDRGHPCFWATDNGADGDHEKLGIYQPMQKRYDRSRPSAEVNWYPKPTELEYVGVPDVILDEKGVLGKQCLPLPKDNWNANLHVSDKKETLKHKLNLFQEFTPQSEELVVVGTKIKKKDETRAVSFDLQKQSEVSQDEDVCVCSIASQNVEPVRETITAAIDGEIFNNSLKTWVIYFDDCLTNEYYEKCLSIENLNNCCLRYSWEAVLPSFIKSPLPLKKIKHSKTFYFDRNDGVILPQSSGNLTFGFESLKAGVFNEKWILHLSNAPDKEEFIAVELQSVVEERPDIEENLKVIDSYIESCMRYTIASKTVKEIFERCRPERAQILPYDWLFFEEQIFLFNNPDLFYESKYVSFLKEIYKRIDEGPWDFSVQNLRKRLLEKTLQEDITETINEFTATVCHLMKPKLNCSLTNEKYKSVYELLCCFIDTMEKESDSLKCILKLPLKIVASLNIADGNSLTKPTRSSKLTAKESITSKKSNRKHSKKKIKFSIEKTLSVEQDDLSLTRQKLNTGDSSGSVNDDVELKMKKQEYLEALYIKTYHHLCVTIDNIGAVIDSFDAQKQKSALLALKSNPLYSRSS